MIERFLDWFCDMRIRGANEGYFIEPPTIRELMDVARVISTFK